MINQKILHLRQIVDNIDNLILKLLEKRFQITTKIQKLKSESLNSFFSPERENEILKRCNNPKIFDVYVTILKNSRTCNSNIKWYFFNTNIKKDNLILKQLVKHIFGNVNLKKISNLDNINLNYNFILISQKLISRKQFKMFKKLYHYCTYKNNQKNLFHIYSNLLPTTNKLPIIINLKSIDI